MSLVVELTGLELHGFHGVEADERRDGQRFLFDVRIAPAGGEAAASDRIEDALDYRDVVAIVREVSEARAYALLEALAAAVADALIERLDAVHVQVRVRKPDVRLSAPVEHAAVTVERSRAPS